MFIFLTLVHQHVLDHNGRVELGHGKQFSELVLGDAVAECPL